jgi:hypothetical protein
MIISTNYSFEDLNAVIILAGNFESRLANIGDPYLFPNDTLNLSGDVTGLSCIRSLKQITMDNFGSVVDAGDWNLTREQKTAVLDALAGPTEDNRSPVSVFDVHFQDGSKVIASADQETWRRIVARIGSNLSTSDDQEALPWAAVDVSLNSYSSDGSINWTLAAPSWQAIISGVVFPIVGTVAALIAISVAVYMTLGKFLGFFWAFPVSITATILFVLFCFVLFIAKPDPSSVFSPRKTKHTG